jgi:hypothetical protein
LKKKRIIAAVLLVLATIVLLPLVKFYFIRKDGGGGVLLWRSNEAYIFLYDGPVGYHLSCAAWLVEPALEFFYAPAIPENNAVFMTVLHISPSGVEHYIQKSKIGTTSVTPIGDTIYSFCPAGVCKWTGAQFELVSNEEELKMGGLKHLMMNDRSEFTNADGWSKRLIRSVGPEETPVHGQFSIEVNKQINIVVTEGNPTSVDLQRPGKPSERIWYYKRGTSMVSEAKYKSVFESH